MEESIFIKETNAKEGKEKSPSRLQKQAPASLQVDRTTNALSFRQSPNSHTPIPLLSPLILSPTLLSEVETEDEVDEGSRQDPREDDKVVGLPPLGGWQHPAAPMSMEPSSLLKFFQSQCAVANSVQ